MITNVSQSTSGVSFGARLKIYDYQNRLSRMFSSEDLSLIQEKFAQQTVKDKGEIQYLAKYGNEYVPDTIKYIHGDYVDTFEVVRESDKTLTKENFADKMVSLLSVFKMKEAAKADIAKLQKKINSIEIAASQYCNRIIDENFKTPARKEF